ncbi:hypothetical protein K443DRAFT_676621 [Laccaria amethystina LaAM-08-1]|uniref:Uncharacterized protein n=1 Tax=Laccaria amethystina LaAM-08-1 TaxID=1095629 RepID=A0A0C9WVP9_9AGAR|nr:hypothetical protein K443DRAFT_676621 [Laccaria amethystina LaAM-08-1]
MHGEVAAELPYAPVTLLVLRNSRQGICYKSKSSQLIRRPTRPHIGYSSCATPLDQLRSPSPTIL